MVGKAKCEVVLFLLMSIRIVTVASIIVVVGGGLVGQKGSRG